jgi:DNA repair photolyase
MNETPTRGFTQLFEPICHLMWSVTPYQLCDYRCVYCCTGAQGESVPILTPEEAAAETRRVVPTLGVEESDPSVRLMILGAFGDAYPSVEAGLGITRAILAELVDMGERISIVTKGTSVLRDVDLLLRAGDRCTTQISVCSTDDDALRGIDGSAPSGSARFAMVEELHRAGVPVEVNALPWIPGITDTEALIDRVPSDVVINFSPLSFGEGRDRRTLLGHTYTRADVWTAYQEAYEAFGHIENTSWIRPSPPPTENHPLARLPRLERRGRVANATTV